MVNLPLIGDLVQIDKTELMHLREMVANFSYLEYKNYVILETAEYIRLKKLDETIKKLKIIEKGNY